MNASASPAPIRHAPIALWRIAEAFMRILHALFGAPEDVARRHTLTAKPYRLLLAWLGAGEAMMRRLLLIEASAFPKPNVRPLLHKRRKRVGKLMGFDAAHPERWRVSFRCLLGPSAFSPACSGAGRRGRRRSKRLQLDRRDRWHQLRWKPQTFHSAWPAAERYEALLRVFNDPTPYARRLARRLHATPHRRRDLLRAPPDAAALIGAENFALLTTAAARCDSG